MMKSPQAAQKIYQTVQEKEQHLKILMKSSQLDSKEVYSLQVEIRECYEKVLSLDCLFASNASVEQNLWKSCFHRRIEDFRKRIDKFSTLIPAESDQLHRIRKNFQSFLSDASSSFAKILALYEAEQQLHIESNNQDSVDCLAQSIHRCQIFLGDLTRYRILHCENATPKDFSPAECCYQRALQAMPHLGNPHNQMAVIAMYNDAECVAVYRYCRSLFIKHPFMTARDNLVILFERNRLKLRKEESGRDDVRLRAQSHSGKMNGPFSGKNNYSNGIATGRGSGGRGNTGALLKSFLRRFVRLHGIIFTADHEELDRFPEMFSSVISDFRTLLYYSAFGDALLLKMVVICTFTVLVTEHPCEVASIRSQEMPDKQRQTYLSWALALAFGIVSQIGGHVRTQNPQWPSLVNSNRSASDGWSEPEPEVSCRSNDASENINTSATFSNSAIIVTESRCDLKLTKDANADDRIDSINFSSNGSGKFGKKHQNSCQARPLGSRLLGPVVLFCDWLQVKPEFRVQNFNSTVDSNNNNLGSLVDSSKGEIHIAFHQERAKRAEFWDVVCHLANTLPEVQSDTSSEKMTVLREHIELEGYTPFEDILFSINKRSSDILKNSKSSAKKDEMDHAEPPADDNSGAVRIRAIKAFCEYMATTSDLTDKMKLLVLKDATSSMYFTAVDGASKADSSSKPFVLKQVPMPPCSSPEQLGDPTNCRSKSILNTRSVSNKIRTEIGKNFLRHKSLDDSKKSQMEQPMLKHTRSWHQPLMPPHHGNRDRYTSGNYVDSSVWAQPSFSRREEVRIPPPNNSRDRIMMYRKEEESGFLEPFQQMPYRHTHQYSSYNRLPQRPLSQSYEAQSSTLIRARSQPDVFFGGYSDPYSPSNHVNITEQSMYMRNVKSQAHCISHSEPRNSDFYSGNMTPTPLASWKPTFSSTPGTRTRDLDTSNSMFVGNVDNGFGSMFNSGSSSFDHDKYRQKSDFLFQTAGEDREIDGLRVPYAFNLEGANATLITEQDQLPTLSNAKHDGNDTYIEPNYEMTSKRYIDRERFIKALSISPQESSQISQLQGENSNSVYSHFQMFKSPYPLDSCHLSYGLDSDTPKTVVDRFSL